MKYQLMISDFDGTLGEKEEVYSGTVKAIKEFEKKGGKFVICTGRHFLFIKDICANYGFKGIVATCQGVQILDIESEKVVYNGKIEKQTALKLIKEVRKDKLPVCVYIENQLFVEGGSKYADFYTKYKTGRLKVVWVNNLEEIIENSNGVLKFIIDMVGEDFNDKLERYKKIAGKDLMFNSGADWFIEVINPKFDKNNAVRYICNYYNIPYDKVITVGDATNDIGLVSGEWHGVAVGNAKEELKAVAKEITVPFSEHPVKYLLEKYCL